MIIVLAETDRDMRAIERAERTRTAGLFHGRPYAVMRILPGKLPLFDSARRDDGGPPTRS